MKISFILIIFLKQPTYFLSKYKVSTITGDVVDLAFLQHAHILQQCFFPIFSILETQKTRKTIFSM